MVLEKLLQVNADGDENMPRTERKMTKMPRWQNRVTHTHHKVTLKTFKVSGFQNKQESKIWFTLRADSPSNTKSLPMGKIVSNKTTNNNASFDTQHEMLVDSHIVHGLSFKLKCKSGVLGRHVTIGKHYFDLTRESVTSGFVLDENISLKDSSGIVVATVRLFVQIAPTPLPALLLSPSILRSSWSSGTMESVFQGMVCEGREAPSCKADTQTVTYVRNNASNNTIHVSGSAQEFEVQQRGDAWSIVEHAASAVSSARPPPARKFVLHARPLQPDVGQPDSPPMEFSLEQTGGCPYSRSSIALIAGNVFDTPDVDGAADWGVWTLVRSSASSPAPDMGRVGGGDVIGVIHVAGPCVECRGPHELGLAVAVGNAMLWACVLHGPGRHSIQRLISRVARRPTAHLSAHGTAEAGRGFLPLADGVGIAEEQVGYGRECLETRMKLSGIGQGDGREEKFVIEFLAGQSCL